MRIYLAIAALLLPLGADALQVFACEPEWGALARELAADELQVTVATTAFQDPHRLQAKPSLIAAIRDADLVVCTGADLEIGWLPLLLRRAGRHDLFYAADWLDRYCPHSEGCSPGCRSLAGRHSPAGKPACASGSAQYPPYCRCVGRKNDRTRPG